MTVQQRTGNFSAAGTEVSIADPRSILLVDPSLFTAPYDAALSDGLEANGLSARWATRRLRGDETDEIGATRDAVTFYPLTDGPRRRIAPRRWLKGIEHIDGMRRLLGLVGRGGVDLVHFQWIVVPRVDGLVMRRIRRQRPVVLTVHDTTPFNGKSVSGMQRDGFDAALAAANRLIVHTDAARETLVGRGIAPHKIAVVPHGLLRIADRPVAANRGSRWRIVQFGKIQAYKGVDILVEALGLLSPDIRARLSVVVAGEPLIDMAAIRARAAALGLDDATIEFRLHRHSDAEMADLFGAADAFVFPYREIEASGVLFLVAEARKWLIASDIGAFRTMIGNAGDVGNLVPPGDAGELAAALTASIGSVPSRAIAAGVPDWAEIGAMTLAVYRDAARDWQREHAA